MADKGFAKRLTIACDGHPHVPPYGQGRQSWIKKNVGVSHEAVSRWFSGTSRPRPGKMRELARVLEVDEAWLSLGITPEMGLSDARIRNTQAGGASNTFMGLVQLNGARVALPDDKDPRAAFVDFYAIFHGQQVPFHVALASEVSAGTYRLILPKEYEQCVPVGVVHSRPMQVQCLKLPCPLVDRHKQRRGGYYEIFVTRVRQTKEYATGKDVWPSIDNFNDF